MRIGIFGGTFDPPHVGHLLAASDALDALALDRLVFVPAARQPFKADGGAAPPEVRLAMVRALVGSDPRFAVDPIEIERGGLSYTVETIRALHARWQANGAVALFLLLGADSAQLLPKWREPDAIAELAEIVILARNGDAVATSGFGRAIATRRIDVSSTEIRSRVHQGRPIRGFVPEAVEALIIRMGLYR
jgi:nicotinate-nucleotide adenylyltransferase